MLLSTRARTQKRYYVIVCLLFALIIVTCYLPKIALSHPLDYGFIRILYFFNIEFVPGVNSSTADSMSRLNVIEAIARPLTYNQR
jgi:hypothetical protein